MDLRSALRIAAMAAAKEGRLSAVNFTPGKVSANDGTSGVFVACDHEVEGCVGADQLKRAVGVAKKDIRLYKKGKSIYVEEKKGSKFRLAPLAIDHKWQPTPTPKYTDVPPAIGKVLRTLQGLYQASGFGPEGVGLAKQWIAASNAYAGVVLWTPLLDDDIMVDPRMLSKLEEGSQVGVKRRKLYIKSGDAVYWSKLLTASYPHGSMQAVIEQVRADADRVALEISIEEFRALMAQAVVAVGSDKVAGVRVQTVGTRLVVSSEHTNVGFEGGMVIPKSDPSEAWVSPRQMIVLCSVLSSACEKVYLSIGGERSPLRMWGTLKDSEVSIETIIAQVVI